MTGLKKLPVRLVPMASVISGSANCDGLRYRVKFSGRGFRDCGSPVLPERPEDATAERRSWVSFTFHISSRFMVTVSIPAMLYWLKMWFELKIAFGEHEKSEIVP